MTSSTERPNVDIRRAADPFDTKLRWLDSHHSFSLGPHWDPNNTHFGLLLVNNDDVVRPGTGFDTHPHRDMEIVTWVLRSGLVHQDSEGHSGVIYPGLAQRMSAGTGILDSENNDAGKLTGGPMHADPVQFVQPSGPSLALASDALGVGHGTRELRVDARVPLLIHVSSQATTLEHAMVMVFDGDPQHGGKLIAAKTVPGVPSRTGASVLAEWRPTTPGAHHLVAQLVADPVDLRAGNTLATLNVDVRERLLPTPTFGRLRDALSVVALSPDVKAKLVSLIDRAEQAYAAGRLAEARSLLQEFIGSVRGSTSPFMAGGSGWKQWATPQADLDRLVYV